MRITGIKKTESSGRANAPRTASIEPNSGTPETFFFIAWSVLPPLNPAWSNHGKIKVIDGDQAADCAENVDD